MGDPPMIAFRRNLDPDCGLLSGESRFAASPSRLDAALRRTWGTYQRMRAGQLARCPFPPPLGGIIAEARPIGPSLVVPVSTVMPSILCSSSPMPGVSPLAVPACPSGPTPAKPAGLTLVQHLHVCRTCPDSATWASDRKVTPMSPATMNPGFILPNDLIDFDRPLDNALIDLMVRRYPMLISRESVRRKQPGREDRIRIALVGPDGEEDLPTWIRRLGSTQLMSGASTAKIALFYASHQLLCDLRELARTKSLGRETCSGKPISPSQG